MGRSNRNRKPTKKDPPKKKGRGKKQTTQKEEEPTLDPFSPTSPRNDENLLPPSKEEKSNSRAHRTRTKKTVSYHEDSDTDPCSEDEDSDVGEDVIQAPPKGKKRPVATKKKPTAKATKKQKVDHSTPSVRPPDGNSPRPIVGKEIEPSPQDDWRSSNCIDW